MKKIYFLFILIVTIFFSSHVYAEDYTYIEGEDSYNKTAEKIITGDFLIKPTEIIKDILENLFSELTKSRKEMIFLIVIAALSGVLQILKTSTINDEVGEAAFFVCFTIMSISAMRILKITIGYGADVISQTGEFVTKLSPVFMALLVSGGSISSAAAFHPVLSAGVYVMTLLVDKCIVPLVYFGGVLGIVGNISPKLQIKSFTRLIRAAGKWILTASLTIFSGVTAIYGFSAPVLDAVSLKAIKFAVGSFVPVVGGLLSDTVETVLSGTRLMKNAVGTAGIISLGAISITPVLKILAIIIMLEICAAAAEPLTDRRVSEMLRDIAASASLILGMIVTVSMLFIINIGIILSATR